MTSELPGTIKFYRDGEEIPLPGQGVPGPRTRAGSALLVLADEVQADLRDVLGYLGKAQEILGHLEDEIPGVNGLASASKGWRTQLEGMMATIQEKGDGVRRKLLGQGSPEAEPDPIQTQVNEELLKRVQAAKGEETKDE